MSSISKARWRSADRTLMGRSHAMNVGPLRGHGSGSAADGTVFLDVCERLMLLRWLWPRNQTLTIAALP